ncbi:pantoate--beta-alanine ligase [Solemya pervernicosa gill symbiont]|uniref:Pantothenate synthetase n=2 Tax=Gammaproteobacteria incertae sedis TaxID=118884 RepID=A0A1T2L9V5_9GAMM|nr:pantoate--beta-alanine ligase [Candidatus Reidiella endopervernicosa]OOZ41871.1 pantoate--beta-alanine ligase [Solemya pervernicosa gill symbiont]QKQ28206.1 pantoate--beta-alanine ligase [Candidatus Reidiella endopervernicosa]
MQIVDSVSALREQVSEWRRAGERIAFVPTMGNLHRGHLQLAERAAEHAERVVVSIYVNPIQFNDTGDFSRYPRTLQQDSEKLAETPTALIFAPTDNEMYPHGRENLSLVEVPHFSDILCGASRAGHFVGVATVVSKLFNMVQPDVALFGEKDFQQLLVIRRMVRDLDFRVEIVGEPTVREPDGLAMSSRNGYLTEEERKAAPGLYKVLNIAADRLQRGEREFVAIERECADKLDAMGFKSDYFAIRDADELAPPKPDAQRLVILAAAYLGKARLIDNLPVTLMDGS